MSNNGRAGSIDLSYGNNGVAPIPAQEPFNPDAYTLQVYPSASAPDGSMAFYGYNTGSKNPPGLFTRLNAEGCWDSATGHVPASTGQTGPLPEYVYDFTAMTHALVDGKGSYITAARVWYVDDPENLYLHVAIGRYQAEDFKPSAGFGDDGIALPEPPGLSREHSRRTAFPALWSQIKHQGRKVKGGDYRDTPKLGLIDGTIRVIFGGGHYTADTDVENTWCALLDVKTGKPVKGLGLEGRDSQHKLALIDGESVTIYQAVFFDDGGFLLLSEVDDRIYLHRFLANALPDKTFANGKGYIELPGKGHKAGMAVKNNTIVVSRSQLSFEIDLPTELYCYTLAGEQDPTFRRTLRVVGHTLSLDHLSFDSQGRLVLAGQSYFSEEENPQLQSTMQVVRLLSTGEPDFTFGEGGYAPTDRYRYATNGLYLDDQGIRVLTLMPVTLDDSLYEYMIRLNSEDKR